MKVTVACMVGVGENLQCELEVDDKILLQARKGDYQGLDHFLRPAYRVLDARRWELNKRLIAGHQHAQKLPPAVTMALQETVDILHGRAPATVESQPTPEQIEADQASIQSELAKLDQVEVQPFQEKPILSVVKPSKGEPGVTA
jgi:hypothetical protein